MRFLRLMAITVLSLACVVLGSACAGDKGEQGQQGETGATGATGLAGPQGLQGLQGLQGIQGIQGIQGEKGDTGLAGVGIAWLGEWNNSTAFGINDAVGYQGSSYVSRQNGNTNHVPTDTGWWDLWVEKGETGGQGQQGIQGVQGEAGPNWIVAMGIVNYDGDLVQGYNVFSSAWVTDPYPCYKITITDRPYSLDYVTIVSPYFNTVAYHVYNMSADGALLVVMYDTDYLKCGFSFMVLDTTP
jgi:hypothetical protein